MANHANPHEQAFRRWSIPDFGDQERGNQSFALAPTMRGDMNALGARDLQQPPPSFRVYPTPASARAAFRPGRIAPKAEDEGINARVLLKWTGIGIVAGFAVLAALVVILNFADDTTHTASTHPPVAANIVTAPPPKPAQVAAAPTTPAVTEVELAPTPAPKAKRGKKRK